MIKTNKLVTWADLNPVTLSWAQMMDEDESTLPENEKIILSQEKSTFPDGSSIEVVEYDFIEYFLDKYGNLQRKTTRKKEIKKILKKNKAIKLRRESRLPFGDAIDSKNETMTQNLGYFEMEDPNKETDQNEVIKKVTSGFANVMQKLARRKLENITEPESKNEAPKNTYVPPHMRNKQVIVDEEKEEEKSTGVKVDNFPLGTTIEDLEELFSNCGKIKFRNGIWIHPSGNFAFVNYNTHEDALKAVEMINGHIYGNLFLSVELARPRVKKEETYKKTGYGTKLAQDTKLSKYNL